MRYCQACHRCFNDAVEYCLFDQTPTCEVERLPVVIDGKYRLEQLIAHGGMGSVYRATHLQLERAVAIKILRAEFLTDEKVIERFKREARAAARLRHANVIAIYDFGLLPAGGGAYLVMELIEGLSLREEMRANAVRHGQMSRERAAALMRQVCAGVESAHQHGIIHRDLKPDNIMIETEPGGGEIVKVLDFGIAKLKESEQTLQSLTDEGTFIGTPNYISPEQCTSLPVDARSDVYSLGVILYELLTGRVPFSGGGTSAVLLRHLQEPPAPPSRFRPDIGAALEQVVLRALAKSPSQRFNSAAQFGEHLTAAVQSDAPVEAEPVTQERWPMVIPFPARRQPTPVEMALTELPRPTPKPAARAPQLLLDSRPRPRYFAAAAIFTLALLAVLGYAWQQRPGLWPVSLTGAFGGQAEARGAGGAPMMTPQPADGQSGDSLSSREPERGLISSPPLPLDPAARVVNSSGGASAPASLVKPGASSAALEIEQAQRAARAVYAAWARTAMRGDWKTHLSFYADRVNYYSDGVIPRAKVEARKRRTFGPLDSFRLGFEERPEIYIRMRKGEPEADVVFTKQWSLSRGRQRAEGKARTLMTLRRDAQGWRIVAERQLRLYRNATRTVKR
jgi:serine/threonine protein kinase/ketosteroid isomerase-like protein